MVHRGAAAVEFALVLIPLLLILLGTIDYGYYFYLREVVTNAAREGARIASTSLEATPGSRCDDGKAAATAYMTMVGLDGAGATVTPAVVYLDPDHPAQATCRLSVAYPAGSVTGFLPSPSAIPGTASAQAQMRLE